MKEVIFHFSPSVRFLGLSLKILFHKNKEIERMLSRKMTFSLMSLITLLAFAFVAPSAMAAAFDVASITADDVMVGGGIEIEYGAEVVIKVAFAEVITSGSFLPAGIIVTPISKSGGTGTALADGTVGTGTPNDGKNFTVTYEQLPAPAPDADAATLAAHTTKLHVLIPKEVVTKIGDPDSKNKIKTQEINLVRQEPGTDGATVDPKVVSITRAVSISHTGGAAFVEAVVTGPFQVKIVLTEKPNDGLAAGIAGLTVAEGTVTSVVAGIPFTGREVGTGQGAVEDSIPPRSEGGYGVATDDNVPAATGRDGMYYPYLASITPKGTADTVTIKVAGFKDLVLPRGTGDDEVKAGEYVTATDPVLADQPNGRERLTVKVVKDPAAALADGYVVDLTNKRVAPAGGYLVVAKDKDMTGIHLPDKSDADDNAPDATTRTVAERKYNVISVGTFPNLEAFLSNGGTIDLVSPAAGLVISEIMWGSDASLATNSDSQWIEIKNTTAANIATGDKTHKLIFYGPNETLPDMSVAANNIQDRVGTIGAGGYWTLAGKGRSGRTGTGETKGDLTAVVPTQALISMQRSIDATTGAADGTMASSWTESTPPSVNFDPAKGGNRIASPGDESATYPVAPVVEVPVVAPTVAVATAADIMISEIMVNTGGGRLPQWIELTNVSGADVSLAGWSLQITNDAADDDVVGGSVSINLSGDLGIGGGEDAGGTLGKSLLLVAGVGNRSNNLDGSDRVVDISDQVDQKGRYTLISTMSFMIALVPPQTTGILTYGDTAGNLDEGWELPTSESDRSSLIRREADALGTATLGTAANGWVLASSTALVSGPATWYGSNKDAGTPGYDGGGPLPVSLSHFRPARDRDTGAAVITWSTQSELNNAGFFIKRSQQRDGQFKVINAAMVQGAGTTSEKQFYTYTDTTAQPNVVYYYQIEDVSLDGNRQTLTNGIRLKGHIGAAGKLTTLWGDLKTSQ